MEKTLSKTGPIRSGTGKCLNPEENPCMPNRARNESEIYYLCPDIKTASAGIRRLYRHVDLLCQAGFNAHILHLHSGFHRSDMPYVSVRFLDQQTFGANAVIVIPEGFPAIMDALKTFPGRRFVIALNWDYVFKDMPQGLNWRSFNIERVLVVSSVIGNMISWSMGLPTHVLGSSLDHQRYYIDTAPKRNQVVYIQRKAAHIDILKRLLCARNSDFTQKIHWLGLDGLTEDEYAAQVRISSVFLNLSTAEGYPTSCLEAMAAGTMVAGYDSVGGRELLHGHGGNQNCILTPNGDYMSLAYALEPVLNDLLQGKSQKWASMLSNACRTVSGITLEKERQSLISFWEEACLNQFIN